MDINFRQNETGAEAYRKVKAAKSNSIMYYSSYAWSMFIGTTTNCY